MKVIETKIKGVLIIEPDIIKDHRGYFMEHYSTIKYEDIGIKTTFVQENMSFSVKKGTFRGLHFQNNPMSQAKLVSCTRGSTLDVAVDIRKGSPTYKEWVIVELNEKNKRQFFIPRGFAHGFLTLTDSVEVRYKVDNLYSQEHDRGIRYDDFDINIDWGDLRSGIVPILSDKDSRNPQLKESDCNFYYEE